MTLSGALRDAVAKALAPAPADRYADAARLRRCPPAFQRRGYATRETSAVSGLALRLVAAGSPRWLWSSREASRCFARVPHPPRADRCGTAFHEPHGRSRTGNPRRRPGRGGGEPACGNPGPACHRPCVELLVQGQERRPQGHCEETRRRQPAGRQPARRWRRLRVTVQLIDGRDGTRRWSSPPYEHEQSGILAAQDQIARDVARALSVTLDVGELNRAQGGTTNLEAARQLLAMARDDAR